MSFGSRFSQHKFSQIPDVRMARSKFDRSFPAKDTFDFDKLVPCFVDEVLPGDTINLNVKTFMRLATQAVPLLDNMYVDFFFFFVPNRLVWDNWEKFNGAQDNPDDSTDYLVPVVTSHPTDGFLVDSVADHFGLPTGIPKLEVNALPFRAYNLIYNEWFRDQNLVPRRLVFKNDGPDPASNYILLTRAKKHDYFTSALPWPQKGPSIGLPLSGQLPVYGHQLANNSDPSNHIINQNVFQAYRTASQSATRNRIDVAENATGINRNLYSNLASEFSGAQGVSLGTPDDYESMNSGSYDDSYLPPYALADGNIIATINEMRQAFMMQSLLELDARGGTRYVEILRAHFNVTSPDFRLQRPELLSIGRTFINQHPIPQTSGTEEGGTPQANLAAYSTQSTQGRRIGFSKSFVEHGFVLGLMQARGDVTYQQGLNRMWSRQTRWDYFWPKLQELGEQAILNKELYTQGPDVVDDGEVVDDKVFGYQERYAEYRYRPGEIRGQFRSTYSESLDVWHLAEEFETLPALNQPFIQSNTPIERSLVLTEGYPHLLADMYFDYKHARPMVTHNVPATLGRF